jgi:hypothetical protein
LRLSTAIFCAAFSSGANCGATQLPYCLLKCSSMHAGSVRDAATVLGCTSAIASVHGENLVATFSYSRQCRACDRPFGIFWMCATVPYHFEVFCLECVSRLMCLSRCTQYTTQKPVRVWPRVARRIVQCIECSGSSFRVHLFEVRQSSGWTLAEYIRKVGGLSTRAVPADWSRFDIRPGLVSRWGRFGHAHCRSHVAT